jgi:hypothetical protein
MDPLLITLRLVHIVLGVVWVGMVVFTSVFLMPAVQDAGPEGGKVMAALQRRGVMTVMPLLALGTLLSGAWLYWRASVGLQTAWITSRPGLAFGLGGIAAIVAYVLGVVVMRPAMLRVTALSQGLVSLGTDPERAERMGEIKRLRARGTLASRTVAALLIVAAAAMAVARYL